MERRNPSRLRRHRHSRRLDDLESLCPDDSRYCSVPGEKNVTNQENSTKNESSSSEGGLPPGNRTCEIDEEGKFGTGTQTQQIVFRYQVQTTLNQSVGRMEEEVLSDLEKEYTQLLLSSMFSGSLCSNSSIAVQNATITQTRLSQLQPEDGATVSGLLSEPLDEVNPGVDGGKNESTQSPLNGLLTNSV